ncbi:hypothetical protein VNO77_02374 [Canavalia gladiata]|uniref:Uncharacterized protein n=1 Tax=Canavalia gladiata TaxID=3824 RepID=A0AAN9MY35_CANGL
MVLLPSSIAIANDLMSGGPCMHVLCPFYVKGEIVDAILNKYDSTFSLRIHSRNREERSFKVLLLWIFTLEQDFKLPSVFQILEVSLESAKELSFASFVSITMDESSEIGRGREREIGRRRGREIG